VRGDEPAGELARLAGAAGPAAAAALLAERALERRGGCGQAVRVQPCAAEDGEIGGPGLRLSPRAAARLRGRPGLCDGRLRPAGGAGGHPLGGRVWLARREGRRIRGGAVEALQPPGDALHLAADVVGHARLPAGGLVW
jgi:hypothetical protein